MHLRPWVEVLALHGVALSLRRHRSKVPTYPPEEWFDVRLMVEGLGMKADIESNWYDEQLQTLATGLEELAAADEPHGFEVNGWRAASIRLTGEPADDDELAVDVWVTASGDDPLTAMTTTIWGDREAFAEAAGRVRTLLERP